MKIRLFWLLLISSVLTTVAQEKSLKFYGFIRNEAYVNTYKGVNAIKDMFYIYPNYIGTDANGKDFNEVTSTNMLAVASRLGLNVNGPEILGAKTSAKMEFDFAGKPNRTVFRIRHAFAKLQWEKSDLIMGQTWHPLFCVTSYPRIVSYNTGSPFQPFNRSPLTRFNYHMSDLTLSATASFDLQFLSNGPAGKTDQYKRDGVIPDLTFNAEYKSKYVTVGAGSSYRILKPRTVTFDDKYVSEDYSTGLTHTIYGKVSVGDLNITAKSTLVQNGTHLLMLGGYGVAKRNATTGEEEYTNYNNLASLINIVYGTDTKVGCFGGYSKNLGTSEALYNDNGSAIIWGFGDKIQDLYRASVFASKKIDNLKLGIAYELTSANFGTDGFSFEDGLYDTTHKATNHGFVLSMVYLF